jgi:hypothetical protein
MSAISLDETEMKNSRLEPIKMAWITDFTLICQDRDILVVRECLTRVSKPLAAALEDQTTNSLELPWNSKGIVEVMKAIHAFPDGNAIVNLTMNADKFVFEADIFDFCFKYDIEPLFTNIKKQSMDIKNGFSVRWIKFFHGFKNSDGTDVFKEQINAIKLLMINNCDPIEFYFDSIELDNNMKDIIDDYRFIIKGLVKRLKKTEEYVKLTPGKKIFTVTIEEINKPEIKKFVIIKENFDLKRERKPSWMLHKIKDDNKEDMNIFIDANSGLVVYNEEDLEAKTLNDIKFITVYGIWDNESQSVVELSTAGKNYAKKLGLNI